MKLYCCDPCCYHESKFCTNESQTGLDPKLVFTPLNLRNNDEYLESLKTNLDYFTCGECRFIVKDPRLCRNCDTLFCSKCLNADKSCPSK